ncbi:hypothetical protein F4778DRAFT_726913 [Xylariomycetidae sp. FL2044]|nr:hypothetical protein F4778DRAFT_726913 [Xylariomycetidae sp. FL2044]
MSTSRQSRKGMLKQPGFFFEPDAVFKPHATAVRIYDAFLGQERGQNIALLDATGTAGDLVQQLFDICLHHEGLYRALRGDKVFWDTVNCEWGVLSDLNYHEVELVVGAYVRARGAYDPSKVKNVRETPLTNAVDHWTSIANQVSQMGPASQLLLASRPHPSVASVGAVAGSLQQLQISNPWPPPDFSLQESAWINDRRFGTRLKDMIQSNSSAIPPIPHKQSNPIDMKLFLCFAAITNFTTEKPWTVYMRPITTFNESDLGRWCRLTTAFSKTYSTVDSFVSYAKDIFKNSERSIVVGIVNKWWGTPEQLYNTYATSSAQQTGEDFWDNKCPRRAVAVVLVLLSPGKVQLIVFDPSIKYLKEQMTIMGTDWKHKLRYTLETQFPVVESWYGGMVTEETLNMGIDREDTVQLCCGLIWDVVTVA